jgi:hypothetical protein
MNPLRLSDKIRVEGAEDDSGMSLVGPVKALEVLPVQRQEDAVIRCRMLKHFVVRDSQAVFSSVPCGLNIVAEGAKCLNHGQRKILVAVNLGHSPGPVTPLRWPQLPGQFPIRWPGRNGKRAQDLRP